MFKIILGILSALIYSATFATMFIPLNNTFLIGSIFILLAIVGMYIAITKASEKKWSFLLLLILGGVIFYFITVVTLGILGYLD